MLERNVIFKLTLLFFLLMGKVIRSEASVNVGTVLFDSNDAGKHCWPPRGELLLNARQLMQYMLPDQLYETFDKSYVTEFIDYVYNTLGIIRSAVHGEAQQALVLALCDVIGGYMRVYLLPMSKNEYYNGNFAYGDMLKLYTVYGDVKNVLRTDGTGWNAPIALSPDLDKLPSLRVSKRTMTSDACAPFLFNRDVDLNSSSVIPLPYLDDDSSPHSMAVPFRNHSLRSLQAKSSANLVTKYYVSGMKCLLATGSEEDFRNFNAKVEAWVKGSVKPHLEEEEWYPAFGGVNRILATAKRVRSVLEEAEDKGPGEEKLRGFRVSNDASGVTEAIQRSLKLVTKVLEDAVFQRSANEVINGVTNLWESKDHYTDVNQVSSIISSKDENYPPSRGVFRQSVEEKPLKPKNEFGNRKGYAPSLPFDREDPDEGISFTKNQSPNDPSLAMYSPRDVNGIASSTTFPVTTPVPNSRFTFAESSKREGFGVHRGSTSLEHDNRNFNNSDAGSDVHYSKSKNLVPERKTWVNKHNELRSRGRTIHHFPSDIPVSTRTFRISPNTVPSNSRGHVRRTSSANVGFLNGTTNHDVVPSGAVSPAAKENNPPLPGTNRSLTTHTPQLLLDYIPPINSPYQYFLSNSFEECSRPVNSTFAPDTELLQLPTWTGPIGADERRTWNGMFGLSSTESVQPFNSNYQMNLQPNNVQNPSINFIPTTNSNIDRGNYLHPPNWSQDVSSEWNDGNIGLVNSKDIADKNSTNWLEMSYIPVASLTSPGGISTKQISSLQESLLLNTLEQVPNNGYPSRYENGVQTSRLNDAYFDLPSNSSSNRNELLQFGNECTAPKSRYDNQLSYLTSDSKKNSSENMNFWPIKTRTSKRSLEETSSNFYANPYTNGRDSAQDTKIHKNSLRNVLEQDFSHLGKMQRVRAVHGSGIEDDDDDSTRHLRGRMKVEETNTRFEFPDHSRGFDAQEIKDDAGYIPSGEDRKEKEMNFINGKRHKYGNMFDSALKKSEALEQMNHQRKESSLKKISRFMDTSELRDEESSNSSEPDLSELLKTNSPQTSSMSLQMQNSMVKAAVMEEYLKESMQNEKEDELSKERKNEVKESFEEVGKLPVSVEKDDKFSTRNSLRFGKHGHPKAVIPDKKSVGLFRHRSGSGLKANARTTRIHVSSATRRKGSGNMKQQVSRTRGPWDLNDADDYKEEEDEDDYAVENYKKSKNIDLDDVSLRKVRRNGNVHGSLGSMGGPGKKHGSRMCWFMFRVVKQEVSTLIISPDLALTNFIMTILFWFVLWFSYFLLTGRTCPCVEDESGEGCKCTGKGMQCIPLGGEYYMVKCPCGEQSYLKTTEVPYDKGEYPESEEGGWGGERRENMSQTSHASSYSQRSQRRWPKEQQYEVHTTNVMNLPPRSDRFETDIQRAKSETSSRASNKQSSRSKNRRSSSSSNMDNSWQRRTRSTVEPHHQPRTMRDEVYLCEPNIPVWRDVETISRGTSEPAYSAADSRDTSPKSLKPDRDFPSWNPKLSFHDVEHTVHFVTPISPPMQNVSYERSPDAERPTKSSVAASSSSQCSCQDGSSVVREVEAALEVIRQAACATEKAVWSKDFPGKVPNCPRHGVIAACPRTPRPSVPRAVPGRAQTQPPLVVAHRSAITTRTPCARSMGIRPMSSYPPSMNVQGCRPLPLQIPSNPFPRSPSLLSVSASLSGRGALPSAVTDGPTQTSLENDRDQGGERAEESGRSSVPEEPDPPDEPPTPTTSQRIVRPTRLTRTLRESEQDRLSQIMAVQRIEDSEDSLFSPSIEKDKSRSDTMPAIEEMKDPAEDTAAALDTHDPKELLTKEDIERRLDTFIKEHIDEDKYAAFPRHGFRTMNPSVLEEMNETESSASFLSDVIEDVTGERRTSSEEEEERSVMGPKAPSRASSSPATSGAVSQSSETSTVKRRKENLG